MKSKILLLAIVLCVTISSYAQTISTFQIDSIVVKAMKTFNVPGISVSIIKDGSVFLEKGYGVRSINNQQPMDNHTLTGIASNSKAFTSAALGILVDEGKLKWDDQVTKYIPEFRMYDDYVTKNFTVRDLLTHRSGLGTGSGDLLHNPDSTDYTITDVIRALRYLKPAYSFRSRYAYDNILYMVAGELVARVSGLSWPQFIENRIMQPLGMSDSRATFERIKNNPNVIAAHIEVNGKLSCQQPEDAGIDMGAGGIFSSAADMSKWMLMQLNDNKLLSQQTHKEMWTPQVILPVRKPGDYNTHFAAYGLGWFLEDSKGYLEVSHTGQDYGMISEVLMLPELHYGITVLSNRDGGGAVLAIVDQITDMILNIKGVDRIKKWSDKVIGQKTEADTVAKNVSKKLALRKNNECQPFKFRGTYKDNWFGIVEITCYKDHLFFKSQKSHELKGEMLPYQKNVWVVKWQNRSINADAFVTFKTDKKGKIKEMFMKAISPSTSVAFDFADLNFHKVN